MSRLRTVSSRYLMDHVNRLDLQAIPRQPRGANSIPPMLELSALSPPNKDEERDEVVLRIRMADWMPRRLRRLADEIEAVLAEDADR